MQQIYMRAPMPKSDFNNVAKQLYWNHTSTWVFSCKFAAYFQNKFSYEHLLVSVSEHLNVYCLQLLQFNIKFFYKYYFKTGTLCLRQQLFFSILLWKIAKPRGHNDKGFLGTNYVMAVNQLPNISMYWDCDYFVSNNGIQNIFTRGRYQEILQNLHFADNSKQD